MLRAFVLAVLVHVVVVLVLGFSFNWRLTPGSDAPAQHEIVQAHIVDGAALDAEVERIRQEEAAQQRREQEQREEVERLKREAQAAERERVAEEKRLALLKKKEEEEQRKKEEKEKQRKEEERKRAEEEQRKTEQKKQQEDEKRRIAEVERQRKAEEKKKQEAAARSKAEQDLQEKLAQEATARRASVELGRYENAIQQKVQRNWVRPVGAGDAYTAAVMVRVTPGGEVLGVTIIESSGNEAFDRSVVAAVYKSTPLPFPDDKEVATYISRQGFRFNFKPPSG